jgi:hypothetical protein
VSTARGAGISASSFFCLSGSLARGVAGRSRVDV